MIEQGALLNNRYRVEKKLGAGGFGQVFEVDDRGTAKILKVLNLEKFCDPEVKEKAIELFKQEAEVLAKLNHSGIPRIEPEGYFCWEGNHCLVMEKIEGQNLLEWLQERGNQPLAPEQARFWLKEVVEILEKLHQANYIHRDIKPSNIMRKPDGHLVLIDFGSVRKITDTYLAKIVEEREVTRLGSTGYMPQEQNQGKPLRQSDFYALGRTFVHLLTGQHPDELPGEITGELSWRDRAPEVSPPLADLIDEMMGLYPSDRPESTRVILQRLAAIQEATGQNSTVVNLTLPLPSLAEKEENYSPARAGETEPTVAPSRGNDSGLPLQPSHQKPEPARIKEPQPKPRAFGQLKSIGVKIAAAGLLVLGLTRLASPQIAVALNRQGLEIYRNQKQLNTAKLYYKLALTFDSNNSTAHHNLGSLYEDLQDFKRAREHYNKAIQGGHVRAYNNMARLYITLDKNYSSAISLLRQGLDMAAQESEKYSLLKNLGWAQLEQRQYTEAKANLQSAIDLSGTKFPAHCLLAQVLEAQGDNKGASMEWEKCYKYSLTAEKKNPEEVIWINQALQRQKTRHVEKGSVAWRKESQN